MSIIIIVLVIGLPSFSKITDHFQVEADILELKNDLLLARNNSILEGLAYKVSFQPYSDEYMIIKSGRMPTIVKKKTLLGGLDINSTSFNDNQVTFTSTGAPNQSGAIHIIDRNGRRIDITVIIATGKVNIIYN